MVPKDIQLARRIRVRSSFQIRGDSLLPCIATVTDSFLSFFLSLRRLTNPATICLPLLPSSQLSARSDAKFEFFNLCLIQPGKNDILSVDARPSDAINVANRCKVPPGLDSKASTAINKGRIYISKTSPQNVLDSYLYKNH
ncbi:hypothetical protein ACB094_09G168100 [Castanea mollissima]